MVFCGEIREFAVEKLESLPGKQNADLVALGLPQIFSHTFFPFWWKKGMRKR